MDKSPEPQPHASSVEVPAWELKPEEASGAPAQDTTAVKEGGGEDSDAPPAPEEFHLKPIVVDIDNMKDSVFFLYPDRGDRLTRFWMLLTLAAIIATSGLIGDSPATVIGAMIVAPLMTPILGVMLSAVLKNWKNFWDCLMLVVCGMACCIAIGAIYGCIVYTEVYSKENNSQIAARVRPQITDFIGALATGAVGSVALVRKDIAGALPGVAISISLVPPLCVVGLTLRAGEFQDAVGSLLLFLCNFMSIQFVGVIVMYYYGVNKMALNPNARTSASVFCTLLALMCLIAAPLAITTQRIAAEREAEKCCRDVVNSLTEPFGWSTNVVVAKTTGQKLRADIYITGPPPFPSEEELNEGKLVKDNCENIDEIGVTFIPMSEFEF